MALLLLLNGVGLSSLLWLVTPPPYQRTALYDTWAALHAQSLENDSWAIMSLALDYAQSPHTTPLYTEVVFNRHIKLLYPPPALFAIAAMRTVAPERIRSAEPYTGPRPSIDDAISAIFVVVLCLATAAVLETVISRGHAFADCQRFVLLRGTIVAGLGLTFYPVVKAFTLGQMQVWINALFALAILCWARKGKARAGVLVGLACLVKPHYGVFLLWAGARREWRFVVACLTTAGAGLAASIAAFGWVDHVDYFHVLSAIATRGEGYYPNQSMNGLLNRLMSIGEPQLYSNLRYFHGRYPPFNPWVYGGTLLAAALILVPAIFPWRRGRSSLLDFCTMVVSATLASPIAWEHHYGVLLPVFAVLLGGAPHQRGWMTWFLLSYVLVSTFVPATNLLAGTVFNVAQSYVFVGAIILLALLYGQRASKSGASGDEENGERARMG